MSDSTYDLSNAYWKTYVGRAYRGLCPRCGEGDILATRTRVHQECSACGLVYRREQGAMTGNLYLSAVVTQIFAAILIGVVFIFTDWSPTTSIIFGVTCLGIFWYWAGPKCASLWVAIEFMTDVGNREDWVMRKAPESDDSSGR